MKTMVKKYKTAKGERIEQKVGYIPFRYILAGGITVLEVLTMIGAVVALCYLMPVAYLAALAMQIFCVVRIVASDDNPDYKIPCSMIKYSIKIKCLASRRSCSILS